MVKGEKVVVDPIQQAQELSEGLTNLMLRDTVDKLEEQKVKLLLNIKGLIEKLTQQKSDQADIYYYLNKKLDDNYEIVASLEEQMLAEQTDREMCEKAFERKIEELKAKFVIEDQKSHAKIVELEETIQSLKEFTAQKQDMDDQLHQLLETLEHERKQYAASMMDVERKWNFDREKTKKEYEENLEVLRSEVQSTVTSKLSAETINTKRLNAYIKDELKYQSGQAELVLTVNENVMQKDKDLKVELSLAQSNEQEILARLVMFQRMTKQLNSRINQEEEKYRLIEERHKEELSEKDKDIEKLNQIINEGQEKGRTKDAQLDNLWLALSETFATVQQNQSSSNSEKLPNRELVLCDVFRRMLKRYPAKFKKLVSFGMPARSVSRSMDGLMGGSASIASILDGEDSFSVQLPAIKPSSGSIKMNKRDGRIGKSKKVFRSVDAILGDMPSSPDADVQTDVTGTEVWDSPSGTYMNDSLFPSGASSPREMCTESTTTPGQHNSLLKPHEVKPFVDVAVQTEGHVSIVYSNSCVWNSASGTMGSTSLSTSALPMPSLKSKSAKRRQRYDTSDNISVTTPSSPASMSELRGMGSDDESTGSLRSLSYGQGPKLSVPPLMPLQKNRTETIQKGTAGSIKDNLKLRRQLEYLAREKSAAFAKSTVFAPLMTDAEVVQKVIEKKTFRKKKIAPFPNSKPAVTEKGVLVPPTLSDDVSVDSFEMVGSHATGSIKIALPPPNSKMNAKKVSKRTQVRQDE